MKRATDRNNKSTRYIRRYTFLISSLLSLSNLFTQFKAFLGKFLDIEYISKESKINKSALTKLYVNQPIIQSNPI